MCNLTYRLGWGWGAQPGEGQVLALHVDTAAGLSYGNRGGQRPPVFFALVILHSCSFLAVQVGVGTMQLRAGLGGGGSEGEEKQQAT